MTCSNYQCATASGRTCVCPCGGAGHGVGRLEWVNVTVKINNCITTAQSANGLSPAKANSAFRKAVASAFNAAAKTRHVVPPTSQTVNSFNKVFGNVITNSNIKTYYQSLWRRLWAENNLNTIINSPKFKGVLHTNKELDCFAEYLRSVVIVDQLVASANNKVNYSRLLNTVQILDNTMLWIPKQPFYASVNPPAFRARIEDHFFCDLFAALAQALGALQTLTLKSKQALIQAIYHAIGTSRSGSYGCSIGSRKSSSRPVSRRQKDHTAKFKYKALKAIVTRVINLLFPAALIQSPLGQNSLVQYQHLFQILAVLLCVSPQQHKLVWDECVIPLTKLLIQQLGATSLLGKSFDVPALDVWDQKGGKMKKTALQNTVRVS